MNKEEFLIERLKMIQKAVDFQSTNSALWFRANYIGEAILQQELRNLHKVIEDGDLNAFDNIKECAEMAAEANDLQ